MAKTAKRKTATRKTAARKSAVRKTAVRKAPKRKTTRKYAPSASRDVETEMRRYKRGTAKSGTSKRGPGRKAGKVKSRKQAIAIGLSLARKKGKKVPAKKSAR